MYIDLVADEVIYPVNLDKDIVAKLEELRTHKGVCTFPKEYKGVVTLNSLYHCNDDGIHAASVAAYTDRIYLSNDVVVVIIRRLIRRVSISIIV